MAQQLSAADQLLLDAAKNGSLDQAAEAIAQGASFQARHGAGRYTALHLAAGHGHVDVVRLLVDSGCDVNATSIEGLTALHLAASQRHLAVAQLLLERGALHTTTARQGSPLHVAARSNDLAMLELLIQHGADIRALPGPEPTPTPLAVACANGHIPVAARLLAAGAGVNVCCSKGYAPLHVASALGQLAAVRLLLGAGAPVEGVTTDGYTPLLLAIRDGHEAIVQELLDNGATPGLQPAAEMHALYMAAGHNHSGIIRLLLSLPEVQATVNAPGPLGATALIVASEAGVTDNVSMLLAAGADVHASMPGGRTAIYSAAQLQNLPMVQQLVAAGADPCAATTNGGTALHHAASTGNLPILQELLKAVAAGQGATVDPVVVGMTPLQMAVHCGHTSCIQPLLAAGADPNRLYGAEAADDAGNSINGTPLHWAVCHGHAAAVPLLTTRHNLHFVWKGQTPLHVALAAGQAGTAQALVAAGSPVGVPDTAGATAMSLAAGSSNVALRALLPAMVRTECARYKELQEGGAQQQQPQRGDADGGEGQQDPAAVLAAIAAAVFSWLQGTAADGAAAAAAHEQGVACFSAVMEVCGWAAAGALLQQVMSKCKADDAPASGSSPTLQLLWVLHSGWLAALQPLLQARGGLVRRLHELILQPLQQQQPPEGQQQEEKDAGTVGAAAAGGAGQQGPGGQPPGGHPTADLLTQARAAAAGGQWGLFVQMLEELMGPQPGQATDLLFEVAAAQGEGWSPGLGWLGEALLGAWWAARQTAATRAVQERAGAVVGAVEAAKMRQVSGSGMRGR